MTHSQINLLEFATGTTKTLFTTPGCFESPHFSPDGQSLYLNSDGKLFRLSLADPKLHPVALPGIGPINNDHGLSPDGRFLAVSEVGGPVYVLKHGDNTPRRISPHSPAYFHGFSPDSSHLAYVAKDTTGCHIHTVSLTTGESHQLTTHPCHDDGPDYSPDNRWLYFNSNRAGHHNIWRIPLSSHPSPESQAQRLTSDPYVDWFPHPSPNGHHLVFLSYPPDTLGHPQNKNVLLRAINLTNNSPHPTELLPLFGGQGTINVNSWSPDSRHLAYVSYRLTDP